jgi:Mut7-C ubiquitin
MALARFRFSGELNDFLAPQRRSREFEHRCARAATVKNVIEALGVPHTEVEQGPSRTPVRGCGVDGRGRPAARLRVSPLTGCREHERGGASERRSASRIP